LSLEEVPSKPAQNKSKNAIIKEKISYL